MKVSILAIVNLWFEPGTPADAANAANKWCDQSNRTWTADRVRTEWAKVQGDGRLPPFVRPHDGFKGEIAKLVRKMKAGRVRA